MENDWEEKYLPFDWDETLYQPSLSSANRLSIDRRVFNPIFLPYIGFFLPLLLWLPACFNFYQFRQWKWMAGSIVLTIVGFDLVLLFSSHLQRMFHVSFKTGGFYGFHILFTLLGLLFYQLQKRNFNWFILSDGRPHNAMAVLVLLIVGNILFYDKIVYALALFSVFCGVKVQ